MTLSEELQWRGFVNQTTFKDITAVDGEPITFYWGVDPSAPSMTIGNLAAAMMVRHFIDYGHKAVLLIGGATGMIGDPDGKASERTLKSPNEITANKAALVAQYKQVFGSQKFTLVDNYDWFKDIGYLQFLRDTGKHVPMRQMLGRDFVQSRLSEEGSGISYAEFSYVLMQAYDFLYLLRNHGVTLQICGSDQWGNSIAGVDLIRRVTGGEVHVWSTPLIINKATGKKFGKSEEGAIWLDANLTSVYKFYQFWLNTDDEAVEDYIKIYTLLSKKALDSLLVEFNQNRSARLAQKTLAYEVTKLVHGEGQADKARSVTKAIAGDQHVGDIDDSQVAILREEIPYTITSSPETPTVDILVDTGLTSSKSEARRLLNEGAVYVNGKPTTNSSLRSSDFKNSRLIIRRGKAFKDSALVELALKTSSH